MTNQYNEEAGPSGPVSSSFHQSKKCRHEIRDCATCDGNFEWCSMSTRQTSCSKSCWERGHRRKPAVVKDRSVKHCPDCAQVLPLTRFHKNAGRPDGVQSACAECMHLRAVMRKYGLDRPTARLMVSADRTCDICGKKSDGRNVRLDIDHCHETRVVRGNLCNSCNKMLGYAKDDPAHLRAAADYLERHAARPAPDRSWVEMETLETGERYVLG